MSFLLGSTTLPDPNDYSESIIEIGSKNRTMAGGLRTVIRAKKNVYKLGWTLLTQTEFANLKSEYDKNTNLAFSNSDLSINTTVSMERDDRQFTPGTPNYLSNISITLEEV